MSMDLDPVPGLPLITTLFCQAKKKTTVKCSFPDELYAKKSFYGGPIGAGVAVIELAFVAAFILLSFKMKRDITKSFLAIVYIPLGLSSVFKLALAVYSINLGAYGWWYMVFLMFFNWLYTTAVVCVSIGSVIYLSALIVIARKRQNFHPFDSWISFFAVLFFSMLLSGSYHFISVQWNQLPASALFFTYILTTIGIFAEILVCLCVGVFCQSKITTTTNVVVLTGDPVVDDARPRLLYGTLAVVIMNIPHWFEIYVKIVELFTPYLWNSSAEKKVFYTAQSKELLIFDIIRLFFSFFMLIPLFITVSGRFAMNQWIHRKSHPTSKSATQNKVFVAHQSQPLLMETGEKKGPPPPTPPSKPVDHTITASPTEHIVAVPIPHQVPFPAPAAHQVSAPSVYSEIGFAPGMLHIPQNMQTTIVYTPQMA